MGAFAQTAEQRLEIQKDIIPAEIAKYQIKLEKQYNLQQQEIEIYLQKNPTAKN